MPVPSVADRETGTLALRAPDLDASAVSTRRTPAKTHTSFAEPFRASWGFELLATKRNSKVRKMVTSDLHLPRANYSPENGNGHDVKPTTQELNRRAVAIVAELSDLDRENALYVLRYAGILTGEYIDEAKSRATIRMVAAGLSGFVVGAGIAVGFLRLI